METETIVYDDAYTGVEKHGRIERTYGDTAIVRNISKEEAGPNPRRVVMRRDPRIAEVTGGTGLIE